MQMRDQFEENLLVKSSDLETKFAVYAVNNLLKKMKYSALKSGVVVAFEESCSDKFVKIVANQLHRSKIAVEEKEAPSQVKSIEKEKPLVVSVDQASRILFVGIDRETALLNDNAHGYVSVNNKGHLTMLNTINAAKDVMEKYNKANFISILATESVSTRKFLLDPMPSWEIPDAVKDIIVTHEQHIKDLNEFKLLEERFTSEVAKELLETAPYVYWQSGFFLKYDEECTDNYVQSLCKILNASKAALDETSVTLDCKEKPLETRNNKKERIIAVGTCDAFTEKNIPKVNPITITVTNLGFSNVNLIFQKPNTSVINHSSFYQPRLLPLENSVVNPNNQDVKLGK